MPRQGKLEFTGDIASRRWLAGTAFVAVTAKPKGNTTINLTTMADAEYTRLQRGAKVLEADGRGAKVMSLADGRIMKLFRPRKTFTSARWFPRSLRFAKNAQTLQQLGIPTVSDVICFKLPSQHFTGVLYQPLPGATLRQLGVAGLTTQGDYSQTGEFIAMLHQAGILFRSIHLGNVVKMADGQLGLIDIADLASQPWPLLKSQRQRNFRHLFRPDEDHDYLTEACKQALVDSYLAQCPEKMSADSRFRQELEKLARVN